MSYSEDDMDAMGAAAASADYGFGGSSTSRDTDSGDNMTWDDVVNDPSWATTAPDYGYYDDQGAVAAGYNYGFGRRANVPVGPTTSPDGKGPVENIGWSVTGMPKQVGTTGLPDYLTESLVNPRTVSAPEFARELGAMVAPYNPDMVTFAGGKQFKEVNPLADKYFEEFDMGTAPKPEVSPEDDDRNFLEKAIDNIVDAFQYQMSSPNQRIAEYDRLTGKQQTYEKVSDNVVTDAIANVVNPFKAITGIVNTKEYKPVAGGESYQYAQAKGGALSDLIDGSFTSYSDLQKRNEPQDNGGGINVLPTYPKVDEVEEIVDPMASLLPTPTAPFIPRTRSYLPLAQSSGFYSIPSRFTQPNGLLV